MGFRGQVSRNTLAHANEHRDWRIYADFAHVLIAAARDLYRDEPFGVEFFHPDSPLIAHNPKEAWFTPQYGV